MNGPNRGASRRHIVIRFWRGEEKLWKAYWLIGVGGGWLFTVLVENLVDLGWLGQIARLLLLVGYSLYSAVSIWRCAMHTTWKSWRYAARGVILFSLLLFIAGLAGFL